MSTSDAKGGHGVTFGGITMPRGSWQDLVADWQRLEAWGLDSAWLPDRPTNPWTPGGP